MTRIAFLGSPAVAVPVLDAVVAAGHDVAIVVTQPDRRRGRGADLMPTPVKAAAERLGLPVTDRVADVLDAGVERGVVVAFGRLVRPKVLAAVTMLNVHFSLLPRWRGAAPLERAILAGDDETGVCLMELEEGLDTGPVYVCERITIGSDETVSELRSRLVEIGARLVVEHLAGAHADAVPQQGEPTYAHKIEHDELRIDWAKPAVEVARVVRLEEAWTTFRGRRLKVLRARAVADGPAAGVLDGVLVGCADGALLLESVQPEGKPRMDAAAWLNGARPAPGEALGP